MQVSGALRVFVLLTFVALCLSKTEDLSKNIVPATAKEIEPTSAKTEDSTDAVRKKKSATTTLCVEIRPSGPYQRPFQICEPAAESKPYAAPSPSYYSAPAYEEVKPAVTPKPAAAYEAPAKTYSAPVKPTAAPAYASSKPYAAHSPSSYSSVSYRSEDGMEDIDAEEEAHSEETVEHMMRSVGQEYGLPLTYLAPAVKHKQKKGHNGLVITCQPSLAGYAATVPSYGSYGGGYGSYRASTARSYGRYERPSPPKAYGGYGPAPSPPYKAPAPVYKVPQPSYSSYKMPAPSYTPSSYSAPMYRPPPAYNPPAPTYNPHPPAPAYSPHPPTPAYNPPTPTYGSPPAYKPLPPQPAYKPAEAPAPVYQPAPAPAPYSYPSGPSYAPPPPPPQPAPVYAPAPAPKPHPQPVYSPPGTYRAAETAATEDTTQMAVTHEEKEKHTIETMKHVSEMRAAGMKNEHEEAKVKAAAPSWAGVEADRTQSAVGMEEMNERESWNQRAAEEDTIKKLNDNEVI